MDFEAIVHLVLPVVSGQGARGEWTKQEVVFELVGQGNDQFTRRLCVGFWNDKAPSAAALRVGDRAMVSVNIESRERNGRWFTEARGWKFTVLGAGQSASSHQGGYASKSGSYNNSQDDSVPAAGGQSGVDDLPF